jgi:hypothetical protein
MEKHYEIFVRRRPRGNNRSAWAAMGLGSGLGVLGLGLKLAIGDSGTCTGGQCHFDRNDSKITA